MALPGEGNLGGFSSPFRFESEAAAADRLAREQKRKAEEEAARLAQRVEDQKREFAQRATEIAAPHVIADQTRQFKERVQGEVLAPAQVQEFVRRATGHVAEVLNKRGTVTPTPEVVRPLTSTDTGYTGITPSGVAGPSRIHPGMEYDPATGVTRSIDPRIPVGTESGGFLDPMIPANRNPLRKIPVVGGELARVTSGLTSPFAIETAGVSGLLAPVATVAGIGGTAAGGLAGQGLEAAGVPVVDTPIGRIGPRSVLETVGGLYGGPGRKIGRTGIAEDAIPERGLGPGTFPGPEPGQQYFGPDVPPIESIETPRSRVQLALRDAASGAPERHLENERLARATFGDRSANAAKIEEELIAQGVHPQEAALRSTSALRGQMPFEAATGVKLSKQDEAWFWDQLRSEAQYGERINVAEHMQRMARSAALDGNPEAQLARVDELVSSGVPRSEALVTAAREARIKDFPPYIWKTLNRVFGEDFVAPMQEAVIKRTRAIRQVAEDAKVTRLAKEMQRNPSNYFIGTRDLSSTLEPPAQQLPAPRPVGAQEYWAQPRVPQEPPLTDWPRTDQRALQAGGAGMSPVPSESGAVLETGQQGLLNEATDVTGVPRGDFPLPMISDLPKNYKTPHWFEWVADSLGLNRALLSSADMSEFRQLAPAIATHRGAMLDALGTVKKAATSEAASMQHMADLAAEGVGGKAGYVQKITTPEGLREIGLGDIAKNHHVAVPGVPGFEESTLMRRPEFFISRLAAKAWGLKQSGRVYSLGWNTGFQGVLRDNLSWATKLHGGSLTEKQLTAIVNYTERLTGRGNLGAHANIVSDFLRATGFAPAYRISGPQRLLGLVSSDPAVRYLAARDLAAYAASGMWIMNSAKAFAGASVVTALGSSQFGRLKFPGSDTYYNLYGSDNVLMRAVLQAMSKRRVDTQGNITPLGNQKGNLTGYTTAFIDAFTSYMKSGEDPTIGLASELITGSTYTGEKLKWDLPTFKKMLMERIPMVIQDLQSVASTDGPLQMLLSVPGAETGLTGITSYTPTAEKFKAIPTYNTANLDVTKKYLPNATQPLALTANEERSLMYDFLGRDGTVEKWKQEQERIQGKAPEGITYDMIIKKVAEDTGLDPRLTAGALFLHHAMGDVPAYNPEWVKFALTNESDLAERFPGTFNSAAMDYFRQTARERGLIPAR